MLSQSFRVIMSRLYGQVIFPYGFRFQVGPLTQEVFITFILLAPLGQITYIVTRHTCGIILASPG